MSLLLLSGVVSSRPLPNDGAAPPIPGDAKPMPMPIAPGEPPPDGGRVRMVVGTEANDTLVMEGGASAVGGGGDDTFVLVSGGDVDGSERLGAILDFDAGDKLDLSRLGAKAQILGREALDGGGARVSIDYDGDGKEDGFVLTFERGVIAPSPGDGDVTILPYPLPGEPIPVDLGGGIGDGAGDGEFHILPYPLPGEEGEVTILPYPLPGAGAGDWGV